MDSTRSPETIKVFAPWIQKVVDYAMKTEYLAKVSHKSFIPPVRDTLKVMGDFSLENAPVSSPPDYHNTFNGPKLPKRDRLPNTQPPSHLEVSMRTQQLLLKHMSEDRHEKEHLAAELNALHNRTKVVHMITTGNKKPLWKLLQKFFSKKLLSHSHLQELYKYIDQGFTAEDFQDRITPPLPAREPTTNVLRLQLRNVLDKLEATSPTKNMLEKILCLTSLVKLIPMCLPLLSTKPVLKVLLLLKIKMFQPLSNQKLLRAVPRAMLQSESYSHSSTRVFRHLFDTS